MSQPEAQQQNLPFWHPSRLLTSGIVQVLLFQFMIRFFLNRNDSSMTTKFYSRGFSNYFPPNTTFDLYGYVSPIDTEDLEYLNANGTLVLSLEKEVYKHEFNNPWRKYESVFKPSDLYPEDKFEPYFVVVLIPEFAYLEKGANPSLSKFVEGAKGHYIVKTMPLTVPRKFVKVLKPDVKEKKLLLESNKDEKEEEEEDTVVKSGAPTYWAPRVDINLAYDNTVYNSDSERAIATVYDLRKDDGLYNPKLSISQLWNLVDDLVPADPERIKSGFDLKINYATCRKFYAMATEQFAESQRINIINEQPGAKEVEMFKKIVLTTNIYMLIFSMAFISAHSLFSFFALKNDVQFWYNNKSMEGLSSMTLWFNFISEIIIALYILDSEETSKLVIFEIFMGIVSSFWKITKSLKITYSKQYPYIKISNALTFEESKTAEYDRVAIKYTSMALAPCVVGYAIYSLFYKSYKSWYSYFVQVAAGSVYTFGFIMLTPQLYINYKLKSVDHLPWRALIYKSLNTFVDDVASFLIDMPWMHRLSCFRDDIIFIIYLYQRWIYKTDKSRGPKTE